MLRGKSTQAYSQVHIIACGIIQQLNILSYCVHKLVNAYIDSTKTCLIVILLFAADAGKFEELFSKVSLSCFA